MKKALTAMAALVPVVSASAQTAIAPGGTVTGTLPASIGIYGVFGLGGSASGPAVPAPYLSFFAGSGNVFSVSGGSGAINSGEWVGPDGGFAFGTDIDGMNGLSGIKGNTSLALLGVFTTDTAPPVGAAPAALAPWDANHPMSLAPDLHQVFYIGDGRSGFNDAAGTVLQFRAPVAATRLYLGFADGQDFHGTSGYYQDNMGAITGSLTLAPVPEPSSYALMAAGLIGLAAVSSRRRRTGAAGLAL